MSRTKRIYNSYRKYGRFFVKRSIIWTKDKDGKYFRTRPRSFQIKSENDPRYTEHDVWCMGNSCGMCRKNNSKREAKRKKRNKKLNILKFETLV